MEENANANYNKMFDWFIDAVKIIWIAVLIYGIYALYPQNGQFVYDTEPVKIPDGTIKAEYMSNIVGSLGQGIAALQPELKYQEFMQANHAKTWFTIPYAGTIRLYGLEAVHDKQSSDAFTWVLNYAEVNVNSKFALSAWESKPKITSEGIVFTEELRTPLYFWGGILTIILVGSIYFFWTKK